MKSSAIGCTFRTCLISELSLLSGVMRKLDLETPEGGFWRIVLKNSKIAGLRKSRK